MPRLAFNRKDTGLANWIGSNAAFRQRPPAA